MSRRKFIKNTVLGSVASGGIGLSFKNLNFKEFSGPRIISTWNHGFEANKVAWDNLSSGKGGLTAVEYGVRVSEDDPNEMSVGLGGLPDRTGKVTLDACIMDNNNDCGSVSFLENIKNPISVARLVMEKTPHIMLSGKGAYDFAIEQGFKSQNLLTKKAEEAWQKWKKSSDYKPVINIENHDTISMLLIDDNQDRFRINYPSLSYYGEQLVFRAELYDQNLEKTSKGNIDFVLNKIDENQLENPSYNYKFLCIEDDYFLDLGKLEPGTYNFTANASLGDYNFKAKTGSFIINQSFFGKHHAA